MQPVAEHLSYTAVHGSQAAGVCLIGWVDLSIVCWLRCLESCYVSHSQAATLASHPCELAGSFDKCINRHLMYGSGDRGSCFNLAISWCSVSYVCCSNEAPGRSTVFAAICDPVMRLCTSLPFVWCGSHAAFTTSTGTGIYARWPSLFNIGVCPKQC